MKRLLWLMCLLGWAGCVEMKYHEWLKAHHSHENPSSEALTVYLIPHSHDDVGWLKTVDDYYYGGDQRTQWAGVQYTLDNVVSELAANPTYKFTIVEIAFVYRWWNNANETMRGQLRRLVDSQQVEFVNAGWCMSDEANPYYEDIIDQMTIGLAWVKDTLGVTPRVGWHIDPFGHQATNAALFEQFGFNAWFFARIDLQDQKIRLEKRALEMVWHPYQYSGLDHPIFTHVNYYMYSPPPGFCFDATCSEDPIRDDPTLDGYNLPQRALSFVSYFKSMALHYRSAHLLHTLGSDFHYSNARMWFKNMDKILRYVNSRPELGVAVKYATPGEYVRAIHAQNNTYPTKYDDFLPYADRDHGFWTGYFTSRVSLKGFVRDLGRYLQATRTHLGLLKLGNRSALLDAQPKETEAAIWALETMMGILQHHDAVAGTAKQKVTDNYFTNGAKSLAAFNRLYGEVLREQCELDTGEKPAELAFTHWNHTYLEDGLYKALAANKSVLLGVYNPGPQGLYPVRVRLDDRDVNVRTPAGGLVAGDVLCTNTKDGKDCELVFHLALNASVLNYVKLEAAKNGSGSARVVRLKELSILESSKSWNITPSTHLTLAKATEKFTLTSNGSAFEWSVAYNYYESYQGTGQKSGAYIFRPSAATIAGPRKYSATKGVHYAEGNSTVVVVLEGDRVYSRLYFHRLEDYDHGFELHSYVHSIPVEDKQGKEVVLNIATGLANNKTFYTDSNGLESQKRQLNYRAQWPLVTDELASSNYFPVNSHIQIRDVLSQQALTVLVDRSEGGTVLREGCVELMIHRRTQFDDERGVWEPLNETEADGQGLRQTVRHWVVLGDHHRAVQKRNDQPPVVFWAASDSSAFKKRPAAVSPLPVADAVKLYLRPYADGSFLMRLQGFT